MNFTNMTFEEALRFQNKDVVFEKAIEFLDEQEKLRKELKQEQRNSELLHEQLSFARDFIESLEKGLQSVTSAKQARELFQRIYENSYFEM